MQKITYIALICLLFITAGCARNSDGSFKIPLVYRIDIQQGNVVEQSMINQLKPGMTKDQVRFIMGTPLLIDPFHVNRWDYLYSFEPGRGERQQRHITLYFKDDIFSYLEGDITVTDTPTVLDESQREKTVVVPIEDYEEGFFKKAANVLSFGDKKKEEEEALTEDADEETIEGEAFVDETPELDDETPLKRISSDEDETVSQDSETDEKQKSDATDVETEKARRDAEIFEKAGGQF